MTGAGYEGTQGNQKVFLPEQILGFANFGF